MKYFRPILMIFVFTIMTACSTPASQTPTAVIKPLSTATPVSFFESSCQSISLEPTPDAKITSLFPPVGVNDHVKGPQDASMTIIEYGDFQ